MKSARLLSAGLAGLLICGAHGSTSGEFGPNVAANRIEILHGSFAPANITCWAGDQLSWRNHTTVDHEPGIVNADGKFVGFLAGPLKPGAVSAVFSPAPEYDAKKASVGYTLPYRCRLHPEERGVIVVTPTP